MDLKGVLFLAFLGLLDLTPGMSILYREDLSFDRKLLVQNRTVTCSGKPVGSKYSFLMYTCHDIKVDGWPVFHGNNDYKDEDDIEVPNNNGCPGCPCGGYSAQPNDVLALCSALISAQGLKHRVIAAYTPSPICKQIEKEHRIKFYTESGKETWLQVHANNGYLSKLQCRVETD